MIRTLSIARWTLVGLVLAILIVPAGFSLLSGLKIVEVDGRSMTPTYQLGDVVLIGQPKPSDLHPGHVITVKSADGSMYTHRIIAIRDGQLQLKGDGNKIVDPTTVNPERVVGAVRGHIGQPAADLLEVAQTLPMRASLASLAIALVFLPIRKGVIQEIRRRPRDPLSARAALNENAGDDFHDSLFESSSSLDARSSVQVEPMRGNS